MTPVMVTCPNGNENSAHEHFRGERGVPFPSDLPEPSPPPQDFCGECGSLLAFPTRRITQAVSLRSRSG
jgi:hypothetical protein